MGNIISLNDECKKEKEFFFFCLRRIILAICVMLLFFILDKKEKQDESEIINTFKEGQEVICKSSIVSIKNGYKFEPNKEFFVSNGINIFNLKKCNLK